MASLRSFFAEEPESPELLYSPDIDGETRKRIRIAVYAYAYEFDQPVVDDATFDEMAYAINKDIKTRRPDLDEFFQKEFQPDTGQWIHSHPELEKIRFLYENFYRK